MPSIATGWPGEVLGFKVFEKMRKAKYKGTKTTGSEELRNSYHDWGRKQLVNRHSLVMKSATASYPFPEARHGFSASGHHGKCGRGSRQGFFISRSATLQTGREQKQSSQ